MTMESKLPTRVRALILGGGIHGVGCLHDMVSRGWKDCLLLEKSTLASGTSSKSTKLIHGGLRYLKRVSDFGMVREALAERQLLHRLAPDLVTPIELFFPSIKGVGMPSWMVKIGLSLYDLLAGEQRFAKHQLVTKSQLLEKVPIIATEKIGKVYSFWDGQTDDLALVQRIADSAKKLGAHYEEWTKVLRIRPDQDGWLVDVQRANGERATISALYVINCLGPWANQFLEASQLTPTHQAINNKGIHLIFPDRGLKAGMFLQSPSDNRIFFLLPWKGKTLLGTTEELYTGSLDRIPVTDSDIHYLLSRCNEFLAKPFEEKDIEFTFAGLRWLAVEDTKTLSSTSREFELGEISSERGLLITIYGGKLTSYRSLAEKIGDRVTKHFGEFRASETRLPDNWIHPSEGKIPLGFSERFLPQIPHKLVGDFSSRGTG